MSMGTTAGIDTTSIVESAAKAMDTSGVLQRALAGIDTTSIVESAAKAMDTSGVLQRALAGIDTTSIVESAAKAMDTGRALEDLPSLTEAERLALVAYAWVLVISVIFWMYLVHEEITNLILDALAIVGVATYVAKAANRRLQ
jgi:hypothetical protein